MRSPTAYPQGLPGATPDGFKHAEIGKTPQVVEDVGFPATPGVRDATAEALTLLTDPIELGVPPAATGAVVKARIKVSGIPVIL